MHWKGNNCGNQINYEYNYILFLEKKKKDSFVITIANVKY